VAELRLQCAGVPLRISEFRSPGQRQVQELFEIRGSLGGITSATGRTEFSLGVPLGVRREGGI
jgi:hypothetical protein